MARYIKANPKVAKYLQLEKDRNQVKDGNYLLWQADMLAFGRLTELPDILTRIGGISLMAHEARQEQDGTVLRELPTATDERFVIDTVEEAETPVVEETTEPEVTEEPTEATDTTTTTDESEEPAAEPADVTENSEAEQTTEEAE